ncbi:isoflavone-7-O-methyltransferase 8 [Achaetomium macrosporum]|uniref:Isoflavone-7-O-methyltransferase 8 n=1 Tax=Achaetomium macrosporum TaxID=79813 RepID=A0AAN7C208_9PEZI|nr:isoflavone-7-O-methyltransferase 8 [Achaetomium macrosporum]
MAEEIAKTRPHLRQAIELAGQHFINTVEMGVLKALVDYKVFDAIPDEGDISLAELVQKVGGEEELLQRFSAYLVAAEILASPATGRVAHTDRSRAYRSGKMPGGFIVHLPTFFQQHGLASPRDARDVYAILDAEPELARLSNRFLLQSSRIYTLEGVYDFGWVRDALDRERDDTDSKTRPVVVDVGSSTGRALADILGFNPAIPAARCAVLDLPHVVEDTRRALDEGGRSLNGARLVAGSMFEAFPADVRGALVYQFRRVFNDFPDGDVLRAWRRVREAAAPDSRVLVIEELLAPGMNKFSVAQDLTLFCVGGKRRDSSTTAPRRSRWRYRRLPSRLILDRPTSRSMRV